MPCCFRLRPGRAQVTMIACGLPLLLAACSADPVESHGDAAADSFAGDGQETSIGPASCGGKADGAPCDDGSACTAGDQCAAQVCAGQAIACADSLPCTVDSCDPAKGCQYVPSGACVIGGACVLISAVDPAQPCRVCDPAADPTAWTASVGKPCDDADACTIGDACQKDATCHGSAAPCDDGNPCTADACIAGSGCVSKAHEAACDDGDLCTTGDACSAGKCKAGKQKLTCNDQDPCTADACDPAKGCTAAPDPKACDDGKPCTLDLCDAAKGCSHADAPLGSACTTGNACITGEMCSLAMTCGAGTPLDCNDGNPCTDDSCKPSNGCVHTVNKLPCDDGESCSEPDVCTGGACIGVKTTACAACNNTFAPLAAKLTVFQVGSSGKPGEGIDVDGDPKTCAPSGSCEAGVDNSASVLAFVINKPLIGAIQDGSMSFVAELAGYQGEDKEFTLNLYHALLTPAAKAAGCDGQSEVCEWGVSQNALSPSCKPKFSFKNAKIKAGKLVAGGADTLFAMDADLIGAKSATLFVKGARIEATVELTADGKAVKTMTGVLGGAVPQEAVFDMINALDEALFLNAGLTKQQVLALVEMALELDIDIDGDGTDEAASIGLRFAGIGAKIAGMATN